MKAAIFSPTDGRRIGRVGLRRDIAPGYLRTRGWEPGSSLGEPIMRRRTYNRADGTREAWRSLVYWLELTGWNARVELTAGEQAILHRAGSIPSENEVWRLVMNETHRHQLLAGHGSVR